MPSLRDIGTIPVSATQNNEIYKWYFLQILFSTGTVYMTNKHCGQLQYIALSINGPSQNWLEYDFTVGALEETAQTQDSTGFIKFSNLQTVSPYFSNKQLSKWRVNPGIRGTQFILYTGQFDASDTFLGYYQNFTGRFAGGQYADYANVTINSDNSRYKQIPFSLVGPDCINLYRGPDCGFVGAEPIGQVTCDHSRNGCRARTNELNFNGFDLMPDPGTEQTWIGMP